MGFVRSLRVPALLALSLGMLGACGSSNGGSRSEGASCAAPLPCGGDVSGTWSLKSACFVIPSPFSTAECQSASGTSEVNASGTVVFTPLSGTSTQGMVQTSIQVSFQIDEVYSGECLASLNLGGTSQRACSGLEAYWAGPYDVRCAATPAGCDCVFRDQENIDAVESYSVEGMRLSTTSPGASDTATEVDYCRTGDTLIESSTMAGSVSALTLQRVQP